MALNLNTKNLSKEIGSAGFLHAFLSTVTFNLEPNGAGSRFPLLRRLFSNERIKTSEALALQEELKEVKEELSKLPPSKIIWDLDNVKEPPPWGDNIAPEITSLGNYFVTSDGHDLFEVLSLCIEDLLKNGGEAHLDE